MNTMEVGNPQKIYHEIGELIWSIFPEDAQESYFYCQILDEERDYKFNWLDNHGNISRYDFGQHPTDVLRLISIQIKELQQHTIFKQERWTHCKVTLKDKGKLNIEFAYVSQKDSWSGLYMRGISSLTKEEAKTYLVPDDVWEESQSRL